DYRFEQVSKLKFPIIQVMGFEAMVSVVRLVSPKLYTLHKIYQMGFPVTLKDLRLDKIGSIYEGLLMIEELALYLQQLEFSKVAIGTMVGIKRPDVQNAVRRVAQTGSPLKRKSSERPNSLNDYTARHLERIIRKVPFQTVDQLSEELRLMDKPHATTTVRLWLKELGFNHCIPFLKSLLNNNQKERCLLWARKHVNWTYEQWKKVIWKNGSFFLDTDCICDTHHLLKVLMEENLGLSSNNDPTLRTIFEK
ncbi:hypothetical protein INT47_009096, partial [Mucor saturninus]